MAHQSPKNKALEAAIKAVQDTSFDCGEWNRNESDEPFEILMKRSDKAEAALRKLIGMPS